MANIITFICDVLRDLVSFVQFKKREKHPWRSITLSKVAGYLYNLKNVKNTHGGVLFLVKLQEACNFTKNETPPWVFFSVF